jgi:hypothetical protein
VKRAFSQMMLRYPSLILLTIISSVLAPTTVYACSLDADYKGPRTNFELAEQADLIFVGTLVKSVGDDDYHPMILVKPETLLKGKALPKTAYIRGILSDRIISEGGKPFRLNASPSDPFDIWRPHAEAFSGSCSRYSFNQNTLVVLFFDNVNGRLEWLDPAFARGAEDVPDVKALWVRAVKLYADISQLPKDKQRSALSNEMTKLRSAANGNSAEILLADDIERQLANCGPASYFSQSDTVCSKSQWVYNIANIDFARKVMPSNIEVLPTIRFENRANLICYAAAFSALTAMLIVAFFVWRKQKMS